MDATTALAEARELGYKVKIVHLRLTKGPDGARPVMLEARTAKWLGSQLSEKGGATVVEVLASDGRRAKGVAICMLTDNFDRSLGTIIALGRARKNLERQWA